MAARAFFIVVALFWAVMNVLLWRAEYGGRDSTPVAIETVWERVLTAADSSTLQLSHHGQVLGVFRWTPSVVEGIDPNTAGVGTDEGLEGMVRRTDGYRLELDGTAQLAEPSQRVRLNGSVELGTNHQWREFTLNLHHRKSTFELQSRAGDDAVRLMWREGNASTEQRFRYRDLANPGRLLGDMGGFLPPGLIPGAQLFAGGTNGLAQRLQWSASHDNLKVGGARLRVYRIAARLFQGYEAVVYISRAGEILKVELPDGIRINNTALPAL